MSNNLDISTFLVVTWWFWFMNEDNLCAISLVYLNFSLETVQIRYPILPKLEATDTFAREDK